MSASIEQQVADLERQAPELDARLDGQHSPKAVNRKISSNTHDSDSGHERTPSSSASNCSEDLGRHQSVDNSSLDDDSEDQPDCFVDALDDLQTKLDHKATATPGNQTARPQSVSPGQRKSDGRDSAAAQDLKFRLEETTQILSLALSNEFARAIDLCEERAKTELYSSLAHATLSFLRAALTVDQANLRAALASINQSFEVSQSKRRQVSAASMVMRFIYKPNYNTYSDDEIHAELVNAESMLLLSLVSFIADQSVLCLVKGALRIRACYQRYKECRYVLESRTCWGSETARLHFESGVRMGAGIFNLLMSYLPRRVLKVLEYVGFSGSRTTGLAELDRSIELGDGLRSVLSALFVLTYHTYIENLFGLGDYDDEKVSQLNSALLAKYPDSAFFLLFQGRYHQMQGRLEAAVKSFERCCVVQQDWKQFHSICHWEIMWCNACQMKWTEAARYADLLRKTSKWSPSSYQYQYGTFLYAQLLEDRRKGLIVEESDEFRERMTEIRAIIERVPELRIRYAGKTIPADKFAITRSAKFAQQGGRLSQPAVEFLYIWNIFCMLKSSPSQVEALLSNIELEIATINERIDEFGAAQIEGRREKAPASVANSGSQNAGQEIKQKKAEEEKKEDDDDDDNEDEDDNEGNQPEPVDKKLSNTWVEDLCLMYLLKGVCLKHLSRYEEAERAFLCVIEREDQIVSDKFLVPHSAMELAILNLHLKRYESSKIWIKIARHDYTGYLMETIVHFRLHAVSRLIRIEQQKGDQSLDQSPCPSPTVDSMGRARLGHAAATQQARGKNP